MTIELSILENGILDENRSGKRNSKPNIEIDSEIISEIKNKFGFDEPPPKTPESGQSRDLTSPEVDVMLKVV